MDGASAAALPDASRLGTVAIRVADLRGLAAFYERVVGLVPVSRDGRVATLAAELDGPPLLSLRGDPAAPPRPSGAAGLFHVALLLPDRRALADALRRLRAGGATLTGASDHLVSEALYLRDPEGNGIELYRDRPRAAWQETDDGVEIGSKPLDLDGLLAEGSDDPPERIHPDATVGHVHLEVTDLDRSTEFYRDGIGFALRAGWGEARFLAAGGYHHHLGLNTWNGRSEPRGDHLGIERFEVVVPDRDALGAVADRLGVEPGADRVTVADPDGIDVALRTEADVRTGDRR